MLEKFKIEAEQCPCAPYMRGMIFRRDGRDIWVVEACDPLSGKLQVGHYLLPLTEEEKEKEKEGD
jgi:hypothetical protein